MYFQAVEFIWSGMLSGLRGRSIQVTFALGLVLIAFAYLAASFSPRQPQTIALDIGFSVVRFTMVLLALFWVQELFTREIDRKIILHSLALPASRASFFIGRYLSIVALVTISIVILGFCLLLAVLLASPSYEQEFAVRLGLPFWIALAGIAIDVAVVSAVASAIAMISTVPVLPLAIGAAFAIGGKALGASVDYLAGGADGDAALVGQLGPWVDTVRWLIPDLSRLDWRQWSLYGATPSIEQIAWAVIMALSYAAIAVGLGVRALQQREFS
jgi:ABC-type transport system involved in multi-copper enzyme maturation permease subunit